MTADFKLIGQKIEIEIVFLCLVHITMDPRISELSEEDGQLKFRLSGVNVSLANALRRIIVSDIPCVVFRTTPYEENKVDIGVNTTRMNNELIKQRLSCIPIHISDVATPIENYEVVLDKTNDGAVIDYVTTADFRIRDLSTGKFLSDSETKKIFPPDPITQDYIDVVRLRPQLSSELPGESLKFTARLDIGTAAEDGGFNVASACTYGNTPDPIQVAEELRKIEAGLKSEGLEEAEIEFKKKDWLLLKGQTFTLPDSFDFLIETIGQFSNMELMFRACDIMTQKIALLKTQIRSNHSMVEKSASALSNGFDITMEGGYTIGKALEYFMYTKYFEGKGGSKLLEFCGFRKAHPHIDESILRLGFIKPTEKADVIDMINGALNDMNKVFEVIAQDFKTE